MSFGRHALRVALLMVAVAAYLTWVSGHSEVSFADGLRYIHQAERIDQGALMEGVLKSVDHPVHALAFVGFHRILGGEGPIAWERAARWEAVAAGILVVIPLYLLGLEFFGTTAAWLGCLLFLANPMFSYVVVNVLSESTFLVFWTWGMWAAACFLREGRFGWLPLAVGFAGLAYLTRPDGLLLPMALVVTLLLTPLFRGARLERSRWWYAAGFLVIGPLIVVGPYIAAKGGLGTKPSIARLIGSAPPAPALALEREKPLNSSQSKWEIYEASILRVSRVIRGAVSTPLLPFALLGLMLGSVHGSRGRIWIFQGVLLSATAAALVRLHVTAGYCTIRHALVPGMLLILCGAHGLSSFASWVADYSRGFGRFGTQLWPRQALLIIALVAFVMMPILRARETEPGGFQVYRDAGAWIQQNLPRDGQVLDLTDWSLYFSGRPGYIFGDIYNAVDDPRTRWVVVRDAHLRGHFHYSERLKNIVGERVPIAVIPEHPHAGRLQIKIFDCRDQSALSRSENGSRKQ